MKILLVSGFLGAGKTTFIKEMATHNLLGKVIMGIGIALYVLFDVYCFFYILTAVHSLKSG